MQTGQIRTDKEKWAVFGLRYYYTVYYILNEYILKMSTYSILSMHFLAFGSLVLNQLWDLAPSSCP